MVKGNTVNFIFLTIFFAFLIQPIIASELIIHDAEGGVFVMDIGPHDSFHQIINDIGNQFSDSKVFRIECALNETQMYLAAVQSSTTPPRDYFSPLTQQEISDVNYILTTLANVSLLKIATLRSELRKAGDRIEHLHPVKFIKFIFSNEELKTCMRNLRGRGWIWKDFKNELVASFNKEAAANNIRPEHIQDFINHTGMDINTISTSINMKQWEQLLNIIIDNVPRKGDNDRYRY